MERSPREIFMWNCISARGANKQIRNDNPRHASGTLQ